jgi:hypothetical protein
MKLAARAVAARVALLPPAVERYFRDSHTSIAFRFSRALAGNSRMSVCFEINESTRAGQFVPNAWSNGVKRGGLLMFFRIGEYLQNRLL